MEVGRELDRLVAEKVMGWVWKEQIGALPGCAKSKWLFNPDDRIQDIPAYSTDIAAAWQVVESLWRRNLDVGVSVLREWRTTCECIVSEPSPRADSYILASADAATAPHAICLAALEMCRQLENNPVCHTVCNGIKSD